MKGGGLTWVGWLMVGVGGLLAYAGMTGQSLVSELSAVLSGRSPKGSTTAPIVAPSTPGSSGESGFTPGNGYAGSGAGGSSSGSTGPTQPLPTPTYPAPPNGGSW